ncbi:MAG: hypothetical protein KC413_25340, partial [Anaerolineales bacterium]|nr:hypothetical protein [Anaerolineales bacterium]
NAQTIGSLPIIRSQEEASVQPLAVYQNGLRLVGLDWGSDPFRAGLWAVGSLVWQTDTPLPDDLLVTMRLVDWLGRPIAEETSPLSPADYPNSQWQAGEFVRAFIGVQLPFTGNGRYRVQIAVKTVKDTAVAQTGLLSRTWATVDAIQIEPWPIIRQLPAAITHVENVRLGDTIRLLGYDMAQDGALLTVKLYWTADSATAVDYHTFVHVAQPEAPPLAQSSGTPVNGARPVSSWRPGEIIEDIHTFSLPVDLPANTIVTVGMFDPKNPDGRVPVTAVDQPVANNVWPLGPLPTK